MSNTLVNYGIFIASPSGLAEERMSFKNLVSEYNISEANHRGVNFTAQGWEYTLAGFGRPQNIINKLIRECDFFVLLLHDRWGSSPFSSAVNNPKYSSATEEEYCVALECLKDARMPMREIVAVFKSVDENRLTDPGEQLKKVLSFRSKIEASKELMFSVVDSVAGFEKSMNRHLGCWVRSHEKRVPYISANNANITEDLECYHGEKNCIGIADNIEEEEKIRKAETLAEEGNTLEAEVEFSRLIVFSPSPISLARYGRFLRKVGQTDRAKQLINKAIYLSDKSDIRGKAYSLRQLAKIQEFSGDLAEALNSFLKALAYYEVCDDKNGQARTLRDVSNIHRKRGDLDLAIAEMSKAKDLYEKEGDTNGVAAVLGYLGVIYKHGGDFSKALKLHEEALEIHEKNGDVRAVAAVKGNIGVVCRSLGEYEKAIAMHEDALEYYTKTREAQGISREKSNLGVVYRQIGDYDKAIEMHEASLMCSQKKENKHGVAIQYGNLGTIKMLQGQYSVAEDYFRKSLELSESMGDKAGVAIQNEHLGVLFGRQNDYANSERHLRIACSKYEAIKNKYGHGNVLRELGSLYCITERKDRGVLLLERAAAIMEAIKLSEEVNRIMAIIEKFSKAGPKNS